jgi:hypothetical protein
MRFSNKWLLNIKTVNGLNSPLEPVIDLCGGVRSS